MTYSLVVRGGWTGFDAYFGFDTYDTVVKIVGDHIFPKYYKEFKLTKNPKEENKELYNFVLSLDCSKCTSEEERASLVQSVKVPLSEMRKNFLASPFEVAIKNAKEGKFDHFSFSIKKEEKVFVIPIGRLA